VPLVIAIVVVSGVVASFASRAALTRVATRLMAYKAEQLRDFAFSQWEVIENLGFDDDPQYQSAAEAAIQSYSASLLRSETERIFALDPEGEVAMSTTRAMGEDAPLELPGMRELAERQGPGWFEGEMQGERRVGQIFEFPPFSWYVFVTERRSAFYTEIRNITAAHGAILLAAVVIVSILVSLFVTLILRPVERLSAAMRRIAEVHDLDSRVPVEFTDEVGVLAHEFNTMTASLQESYARLRETVVSEASARRTAVKREEETLLILGRATEFRDAATGEHLERVGSLCAFFAGALGQNRDAQELIRRSAPLHDVGKIGISDTILMKPGELTAEEHRRMQEHTVIGWTLLKDSDSIFLRDGALIALSHHERWDGTGYPEGLSAADIPLSGRIVGLVDVFDALLSVRPYKGAWTIEAAREYILEQRGRHFDPALVDLFAEHFAEILAIHRGAGAGNRDGYSADSSSNP
jgi:response regulator RpfG family c-di-GMP phosphodiesterase